MGCWTTLLVIGVIHIILIHGFRGIIENTKTMATSVYILPKDWINHDMRSVVSLGQTLLKVEVISSQ